MGIYADNNSDNDATNPLDSAPDDCTVVAVPDGHLGTPDAHSSWAGGEKARNKRHC